MNTFRTLFVSALVAMAAAHSQMTQPQSTAPMTCRLGGEPQFGVDNCEGPCDMRAIEGNYAIHGSSDNPARVYSRGETVTIKYSRNNHGPGGFNRLTLVQPDKMMDKAEHEKNAFYYSCWGANSVVATADEQKDGEFGYSMTGSDAEQHSLAKGYYTTTVVIPNVIPDGDYILGWIWFGGTGGSEVENEGPATKEPSQYGYFSDYWSCSFVRIEGGEPLAASHVPVFNNDMPQFSSEGCMSANDFPGVCTYEPCDATGKYQKPRPFADGNTPRALTPADFGGEIPSGAPSTDTDATTAPPTSESDSDSNSGSDSDSNPDSTSGSTLSAEMLVRKRSCRCLSRDLGCWKQLAERTANYCKQRTPYSEQPSECKEACCVFCKERPRAKLCTSENVKATCLI